MEEIRFNWPYITGRELGYIAEAIGDRDLSGNGLFTKRCQSFFEDRYGFEKCLLTTSCTDALEMSAILAGITHGDEVIIPSYTFVSTAISFIRQGAKVVFADSRIDHPGINEESVVELITDRTKAIVVVHYAGVACDMDIIMRIANEYNLMVIEDAAQAIDSSYKGKPLGSIGHLAAFSFHETKNITCGEGGLLVINDKALVHRAEIIWEKGTNRAEFFRGEVNKYGWVDIGSSFLPSEILAAFLYGQLQHLDEIQERRIILWQKYYDELMARSYNKDLFSLPHIPDFATNNAHMFYIVCKTPELRSYLIERLKKSNITAVFHYLSLHGSKYGRTIGSNEVLPQSDYYSERLLRLPLFYSLSTKDVQRIVGLICDFSLAYGN